MIIKVFIQIMMINVNVFTDIGNNINVDIVEVPNETAPSIQGFAKPPA